jgi:TatA/E family protein of Tat protein translocase
MGYLSGHWIYLVILFVIVLIIWGPGKLPDVGAGLGRAIREFRKASSETQEAFTHATTGQPAQPQPMQMQPVQQPVPVQPVQPAPLQPQQQTTPAQPAPVEQPVAVTQPGGTTTDSHPQPTDTTSQTPATR